MDKCLPHNAVAKYSIFSSSAVRLSFCHIPVYCLISLTYHCAVFSRSYCYTV